MPIRNDIAVMLIQTISDVFIKHSHAKACQTLRYLRLRALRDFFQLSYISYVSKYQDPIMKFSEETKAFILILQKFFGVIFLTYYDTVSQVWPDAGYYNQVLVRARPW